MQESCVLDPLTRVGSEFIYHGEEGCNLTPDWHPGLHVPVLEFCFSSFATVE